MHAERKFYSLRRKNGGCAGDISTGLEVHTRSKAKQTGHTPAIFPQVIKTEFSVRQVFRWNVRKMAEIVVSRRTFLVGLVVAILAASAISTVISTQWVVGPQGLIGSQGLQGEKGDTGLQGIQGE